MPIRVQIINDRVVVDHESKHVCINLRGYAPHHQADVRKAFNLPGFDETVNGFYCEHINDEMIMDHIIELLTWSSFRIISIRFSHFLPRQLRRLLSCSVDSVLFYLVSVGEGGAEGTVQRRGMDKLGLVDCHPRFVNFILRTLRTPTIRLFALWTRMRSVYPDEIVSRFIGTTKIEKIKINRINFLTVFGRGPVNVQELEIQFDWMTDRETAIRFADTLSRLHSRGLRSFRNLYEPQLPFEIVSDRLKLFQAQTLGRLNPNFKICSFERHPEKQRFLAEQERIAALPYAGMMIMLVAGQKLGPVDFLPKEIIMLISDWIGTSDVFLR